MHFEMNWSQLFKKSYMSLDKKYRQDELQMLLIIRIIDLITKILITESLHLPTNLIVIHSTVHHLSIVLSQTSTLP